MFHYIYFIYLNRFINLLQFPSRSTTIHDGTDKFDVIRECNLVIVYRTRPFECYQRLEGPGMLADLNKLTKLTGLTRTVRFVQENSLCVIAVQKHKLVYVQDLLDRLCCVHSRQVNTEGENLLKAL